MTLQEDLNRLFEEHRGKNFFPDGIINEDAYTTSSPRILYLLKDVNASADDEWDLREELGHWIQSWREGGKIYPMWRYTSYFLQGIYANFPNFTAVREETPLVLAAALERTAFVNVKKKAGKGVADMDKVWDEGLKSLWPQQIDILKPEIVLCGGTFGIARQVLNGKVTELDSGMKLFTHNETSYFDFYHPGALVRKAAMYAYLKESMQSFFSTYSDIPEAVLLKNQHLSSLQLSDH